MPEILAQMKACILSQQVIAIVSHNNPDGDTLGSQLALANAVNQFGIQTILLNCDRVSEKFSFLEHYDQIRQPEEDEILPAVVVFVDCATLERSGFDQHYQGLLTGKTILNVDHHTSNSQYGDLNYVLGTAAANCQVIYDLIKALGAEMTPAIATALYLGLSTDTGSFLFDSVSADTHRLAAILIEAQADTDKIRMNIYESCSRAKFTLEKHLLNDTGISDNGLLAWSTFSRELLQESQADSADIDGLINTIKNITGVEIAVLFREIGQNRIKISLRSKCWADVNVLAHQFGGGGHVRASGCTIEASLAEAQAQILTAAETYLSQRGE